MSHIRHLNANAEAVMAALVEDLPHVGDHKRVDNCGGAFMPVSVETIGACGRGLLFSVTHYYEQNGDLMRDPEMIFLRDEAGHFFPTYFRMDGGLPIEQESVNVYKDTFSVPLQREHAEFANLWMRNIREQQRLFAPEATKEE